MNVSIDSRREVVDGGGLTVVVEELADGAYGYEDPPVDFEDPIIDLKVRIFQLQ